MMGNRTGNYQNDNHHA